MRRRQILSQLNPRDNRAPVPSGAGSGLAAVERPSPVSREEEEASAQIWPMAVEPDGSVTVNAYRHSIRSQQVLTPATDPTAAAMVKKRGRPKGSKNKAK